MPTIPTPEFRKPSAYVQHPKSGKRSAYTPYKFSLKYKVKPEDAHKLNPNLLQAKSLQDPSLKTQSKDSDLHISYRKQSRDKDDSQASSKRFKTMQDQFGEDEINKIALNPMLDKVSGNIMVAQKFGTYYPIVPTYFKGDAMPAPRRKYVKPAVQPTPIYQWNVPMEPNAEYWDKLNDKGRQINQELARRQMWKDDGRRPDNEHGYGTVATDAAYGPYGRVHLRPVNDPSKMDTKQPTPYAKSIPPSGPDNSKRVFTELRTGGFLTMPLEHQTPNLVSVRNSQSAPATNWMAASKHITQNEPRWTRNPDNLSQGLKNFGLKDQITPPDLFIPSGKGASNPMNIRRQLGSVFLENNIQADPQAVNYHEPVTLNNQKGGLPKVAKMSNRDQPTKIGYGNVSQEVSFTGANSVATNSKSSLGKVTKSGDNNYKIDMRHARFQM